MKTLARLALVFITLPPASAGAAEFTDDRWTSMGDTLPGADGNVTSVVQYGGGIVIAGNFSRVGDIAADNIAYFDGTSWHALGAGLNDTVNALVANGSDLYATGAFSVSGSTLMIHIGHWDGSAWHALGSGLTGALEGYALAHDGTNLYVGGPFTSLGDENASGLARWDGSAWHAMSNGFVREDGSRGSVGALYHDGTTLYVGGRFAYPDGTDGVAARNVATWTNGIWGALGTGANSVISSFDVHGGVVYVAGAFSEIGGESASGIGVWDGTSWTGLGASLGGYGGRDAAVWYDGQLFVGGIFKPAADYVYLASWDGSSWTTHPQPSSVVDAMSTDGSVLTLGGRFTSVGATAAARVARYDGTTWSALASGTGLNNAVTCFVRFQGDLYAGGTFTEAGVDGASFLARWDGSAWWSVDDSLDSWVMDMVVHDGELWVAGYFTTAGSQPSNRVARWDGTTWASVGNGLDHAVRDLEVHEGQVVAAGYFTDHIAAWDTSAWQAVGGGVNSTAHVLKSFDGRLYVGGAFSEAGGEPAPKFAVWDGVSWAPASSSASGVNAMEVMDGELFAAGHFDGQSLARLDESGWTAIDGIYQSIHTLAASGHDLFVGGNFTVADSTPTAGIAMWNSQTWTPLGSGLSPADCRALYVDGEDLIVGGYFTTAGGVSSLYSATARVGLPLTSLADSDPADNAVAEDASTGATCGVTAHGVHPTDAQLTYALLDDAEGRFTIDSDTGIVTVAGALDFETATAHRLVVEASEGFRSLTAPVDIDVVNINDNAPSAPIDTDDNANMVSEAAESATAVGITASATDLDGDSVSYQLSDDAGGLFAVDETTGVVSVAAALDFETAESHTITVTATDGAHTSEAPFTVTVTNANDNPPTVPADTDATENHVAEDASIGATVGITVVSTDADGDAVALSLSDNAGGRFALDGATGDVTVAATLDYEVAVSHTITAVASDGLTDVEASFDIAVGNVNDNTPTAPVDADDAANRVVENATLGAAVGVRALSSDADGDSVTYSLSDDAGGRFAIDASTGVVTLAGGLDYAGASSHEITVVATDGARDSEASRFTITVLEGDYEPPEVVATSVTLRGTVPAGATQVTVTPAGGSEHVAELDGSVWSATVAAPTSTTTYAITATDGARSSVSTVTIEPLAADGG